MKNIAGTMGLAALLLAGTTRANDITINWTPMKDPLSLFAPKVAADGIKNVVTIAETGSGLSALETQIGSIKDTGTGSVGWAGSSNFIFGRSQQIGQGSTIALAYDAADNYDIAIEMHQGGQESGSSLWFQLGGGLVPLSGITWGNAAQFGPGYQSRVDCVYPCPVPPFDYGYSPTIAANNAEGASKITTTVVEVHQSAATGDSTLYYHVGVLTLSTSPTISWGPSLVVSATTQGSAPSVSLAGNVAVLVFQQSDGTLEYSIGVVDTATSSISWTTPSPYCDCTGYSPAVSVIGDGGGLLIPGRLLLEAHQVDDGTGPLVYSVGTLAGSSPTSISWSTSAVNAPLASSGCSPSLALSFIGGGDDPLGVSVAETHSATCGGPTTVQSLFGLPVGK
jgi:hypothetical protein